MIKLIKLIKDFDKRLSKIEKALECVNNSPIDASEGTSYKEVIDEWLNGKKN